MNNLNNHGKLNSFERIGFFDIKAIENRLCALMGGKDLKLIHGYYGEVIISINPQKNTIFFKKKPEDLMVDPEKFILWGYGEDWQEIDPIRQDKLDRISKLRQQADELEKSL